MSGFDSLLQTIQRTYAEIAQVENIARAHPNDIFVLANLSSLKRKAEALEKVWEQSALELEHEVCRYRIVPEREERYPLREVTLSLLQFQELFSQIYDGITNKVKSRKRLSLEVMSESALNFGYAYPGSLGVAMTVPSESSLFGGKFDDVVEGVVKIMRMESEEEVREVAETYGLSVVKRAYDWSKTNASGEYGIDLTWTKKGGVRTGGIAKKDDFSRIVELIGKTTDEEEIVVTRQGVLVGIDTKTFRFRFVDSEGISYAGVVADTLDLNVQWAVNTAYVALIEERSTTSYATQETKSVYKLKELKVPTKPDKTKSLPNS